VGSSIQMKILKWWALSRFIFNYFYERYHDATPCIGGLRFADVGGK
jgi:hypothetical protein